MHKAKTIDAVTTQSGVLAALRAELGDRVSVSAEELESMRWDRSGLSAEGIPLCVVHAQEVSDVQAVMRIANDWSAPVVTRGAGTSVAGGSFAGQDEIVLSLLAMNRIVHINEAERYAVVEPGIINDHLDAELRSRGFWFAPDPASRHMSTVGGNIATNAGGLMCTKYGVTREAVLGLTVVLAGGEIIRMGRATAKGVTGLDITGLMVGSEGTLGVIVDATVRIRAAVPGGVSTVTAYFPTVQQAASACSAVTAAAIQPMIMELMDERTVSAVHSYLSLSAPPQGASYVLVQTDGSGAQDEATAVAEIFSSLGGDVHFAANDEEAEELLRIRRSMHSAISSLGTTLIEDVCVPRDRLGEMFAVISDIERKYDLVIPVVAHAGDGNLHPTFMFDTPEPSPTIWAAAGDLFQAALRLGGTLTGEHGVGVLKRRWLSDELGDTQWRLQRDIKRVFDPKGILNPGKVFDDSPSLPSPQK